MCDPHAFTDEELLSFHFYRLTRRENSRLYVLYCKRCLLLVDVSGLEAHIRESKTYHDMIHDLAGLGYTHFDQEIVAEQLRHENTVWEDSEVLAVRFRWLQVLDWQVELGLPRLLPTKVDHTKLQ